MAEDDEAGREVTGTVTAFYPSESEQDPHNVYIAGDRYSTFDDATVADIAEGVAVRFRAERNGDFWNIVESTVEVLDDAPADADVYGGTDSGDAGFSPTDARITAQSLIRSAVLHHQHRDESTAEDVAVTAERFAALQTGLFQQLRNGGQGGEA